MDFQVFFNQQYPRGLNAFVFGKAEAFYQYFAHTIAVRADNGFNASPFHVQGHGFLVGRFQFGARVAGKSFLFTLLLYPVSIDSSPRMHFTFSWLLRLVSDSIFCCSWSARVIRA